MEKRISRVARVIPQGASSQVQNKQLVIGSEGWEKTTPFLFLSEDWFGAPKGFDTHPHRGMQTVTVVLEGALEHRDHTGAHGILRAGDVQWMTAGHGVLHSEMPYGSETAHTLQLWLNLPRAMLGQPRSRQRLSDVASRHQGQRGGRDRTTNLYTRSRFRLCPGGRGDDWRPGGFPKPGGMVRTGRRR